MSFKLFNYPQQAAFGKVLPKSKIYEFAKPSNVVRELFIKQLEQIVWGYKLSPDTINIPPSDGIQEIQILKMQSKVPEINHEIYRAIDEAIPSHIFYEVSFGNKVKLVGAYKRPSDADPSKWVTGVYFESEWIPNTTAKTNIPVALNIGGLYTQMLRILMGDSGREGETLKSQVGRIELIRLKTTELNKLKIKLNKEKQFNRKVEINSEIKNLETLLIKLSC